MFLKTSNLFEINRFADGCQRIPAVRKAIPPLPAGISAGFSNKHTIKKFFPKGGKNFLITFFLSISYRIAASEGDIRWPIMIDEFVSGKNSEIKILQ
jgi:hypothetical protein